MPQEVWAANDYMAVFEDEEAVRTIAPVFAKLQELDLRGVIVTAPGKDVDFVSRFFAPRIGIPEDPVTGSAHCELTPYWARRLGKTRFEARQVSPRGGRLSCQLQGRRVILSGKAVTFMVAEIDL
jgi:predicted PhzF superfamily epimerase YddE/YHI9